MTDQEKNDLIAALKAESTDVSALPEVTDLTGINSLPAVKGTGADATLVAAPLELLTLPAKEAKAEVDKKVIEFSKNVDTAIANANAAKTAANDAAATATAAATEANTARDNATAAATTANDAATAATTAAATANTAAENISTDLDALDERTPDTVYVTPSASDVAVAFDHNATDTTIYTATLPAATTTAAGVMTATDKVTLDGAAAATDLSAETTARQSADTTLQGNIDTVSGNLSAETSARQSADTTLQGNIDKRTTIITIGTWYATAADKPASPTESVISPVYVAEEDKLYNVVSSSVEGSLMATSSWEDAGAPSDTALYLYKNQIYYHVKKTAVAYGQASRELVAAATATALTAETTARQSADTTLQGNIDTVSGNLSTEATTRSQADTALGNRIAALEAAGAIVTIDYFQNVTPDAPTDGAIWYDDENGTLMTYDAANDVWDLSTETGEPQPDTLYLYDGQLYVLDSGSGELYPTSGQGGNIINVTEEYPIDTGYHTLATAIAAVPDKRRALGRCITYETEAGRWATKQFTATAITSWTTEAAWTDFGGTVRSISVNDNPMAIDANGNVDISVPTITVDTSLNIESHNPVQNAAVTYAINEIQGGTLGNVTYSENEDGTKGTLSFINTAGDPICDPVEIAIGSGGGGGGTTAGVVITAAVDNATIREGGTAKFTWSYDHQYTSGDYKGQSTTNDGTVTITIQNGATTLFSATYNNVACGHAETLDISDYLAAGTNKVTIYATASNIDGTGTNSARLGATVRVVALHLTCSYNMAGNAAGYVDGDMIEIPFVVTGSGSKTAYLAIDGTQYATKSVTSSGATSRFDFSAASLATGMHTLTLWAEYAVDETTVLTSETVRLDIMKQGATVAPYVAVMTTDGTGVAIGQYENATFKWFAYHPTVQPVAVTIANSATDQTQTVEVGRTVQTYAERFTAQGDFTVTLTCGEATATVPVTVTAGSIAIEEVTYGQTLKLTATGRSNSEPQETRSTWTDADGTITTAFTGMDWSSNGWTSLGGIPCLKLSNGATATLSLKPFATDFKETGYTFEVTLRVDNAIDTAQPVMTCFDNGKGIQVTGDNAAFFTGQTTNYKNEDNEEKTRAVQISSKYSTGKWYQITFVFGKSVGTDGNRILELFINGNRAAADRYDQTFSFLQDTPQNVTFASDGADVYIRSIRAYNYGLTDDEVLTNRIIDAETVEQMVQLHEDNDVLDDDAQEKIISFSKLRNKGKGTLIIERENKLTDVYATNNKKIDFTANVYYYSPFGAEYDFVLTGCNIRIQGTSSTKYPAKNIRIYLAKGPKNTVPVMTVGGVVQEKNKYAVRPGGIKMNLICLKTDYSDSSMSLNTGGARLFNETMKALDLLTPPQRAEYTAGGNDVTAIKTRSAIDGVPIDVFTTDDIANTPEYVGQYNFNNEKAKSGDLFGMTATGDNFTCPIALETLNNGEGACLFDIDSDFDISTKEKKEAFAALFDPGAEVNFGIGHPQDADGKPILDDDTPVTYTDGDCAGFVGLLDAPQQAIVRLYRWVKECIPAGAQYSSGETVGDIATWQSDKFKAEVADYFDVNYLLTYYLWTDYFLSVDQRAKNMILRTWDGLKWYITYYDGDTQLGKRNDCYLVYDYDTMRDTYDPTGRKFAFEGANSALWNLVLANFDSELRTAADRLRSVLTNTGVNSATDAMHILLNEQAGNWADRTFNKSGYLKYIAPLLRQDQNGQYIFALQGSNEAHRRYMIANRFALLDAKYTTQNLRDDQASIYIAKPATAPDINFYITASALYAFGYGSNNATDTHPTGLIAKGATATLTFPSEPAIYGNDPQNIFGASRIDELNISDLSVYMTGTANMSKCSSMRKIDAHLPDGKTPSNFCLDVRNCAALQHVDIHGSTICIDNKEGTGIIDLTRQTRLLSLDARGTSATAINIAEGAPVTSLRMPDTLAILTLKNLAALTPDGLTFDGTESITKFVFDNCPRLDWQTLLAQCPNVTRININIGTVSARSEWVRSLAARYKGVNDNLSDVDLPVVKGTVRLIDYIDDADALMELFYNHGLTIINAEYSCIVYNEAYEVRTTDSAGEVHEAGSEVFDPWNITNLDNNTGFGTGADYVCSGHFKRLLDESHAYCMWLNNGKMEFRQLSDADYTKYADGQDSEITSEDTMKYIPPHYYKGVKDFLHQKKYTFRSTNVDAPSATYTRITERTVAETFVATGQRANPKQQTVGQPFSINTREGYTMCRIDVAGMRQVRWPGVYGEENGGVFTDDNDIVVDTVKFFVPTTTDNPTSQYFTVNNTFQGNSDFVPGDDYLFTTVPDGATRFYFTVPGENLDNECIDPTTAGLTTIGQLTVLAVDSAEVEAIEPGWEHCPGVYIAVYGASWSGDKLRSISGQKVKCGGSTTGTSTFSFDAKGRPTAMPADGIANWTVGDFIYAAQLKGAGWHCMTWEEHCLVTNLLYEATGTRDLGTLCGTGPSYYYTTGVQSLYATEYATTATNINQLGNATIVQYDGKPNSAKYANLAIGLQNLWGGGWEILGDTAVNIPGGLALWIEKRMPTTWSGWTTDHILRTFAWDGTTERLSRCIASTGWNNFRILRLRHGRRLDVTPAAVTTAEATTASDFLHQYADAWYYVLYTCRVPVVGCYRNSGQEGPAYAQIGWNSALADKGTLCRLAYRPTGETVIEDQ